MPDSTPQVTNPPAPTVKEVTFVFDETKFKALLDAQEKYLLPFSGKRNHNPHHLLNEISKLRTMLAKGERTAAMFDRAVSYRQTPPIVDPNLVEESASTKSVQVPAGLKLG